MIRDGCFPIQEMRTYVIELLPGKSKLVFMECGVVEGKIWELLAHESIFKAVGISMRATRAEWLAVQKHS